METRKEDRKVRRFQINALEPRIAPGAAAGGLGTALDSADTAVNTAPPEVVEHVIETVETENPEVC
ncbi:MAG: hypothetical protein ACOC46_00730 [Pirellulales bacterium]